MNDASDQGLAPITVRVAAAVRLTGLSRSRIYELIQAGDIEIVKVGRATLVRYDSLQRLTSR
jgi:excisionase family DNA binding protein